MTKDIWMTTKDMKSCSTLLVIRKILTKSIIVSNYKSIRMIKIKKSYHTKFEKGCENSETLQECKLTQTFQKTGSFLEF